MGVADAVGVHDDDEVHSPWPCEPPRPGAGAPPWVGTAQRLADAGGVGERRGHGDGRPVAPTVLSWRTWSTSATAAATTSSSTMTTFMAKTWPATLRPDMAERVPRTPPPSRVRPRRDRSASRRYRASGRWDDGVTALPIDPSVGPCAHVYTAGPEEARAPLVEEWPAGARSRRGPHRGPAPVAARGEQQGDVVGAVVAWRAGDDDPSATPASELAARPCGGPHRTWPGPAAGR